MSVRHGSMYERLIKSLEEAVEMLQHIKDTEEYVINREDDAKLKRCQQTIRAGKAFVEVQNLDYRDYLEVKKLLKEQKE